VAFEQLAVIRRTNHKNEEAGCSPLPFCHPEAAWACLWCRPSPEAVHHQRTTTRSSNAGPKDQPHGRWARSFEHLSGKDAMGFSLPFSALGWIVIQCWGGVPLGAYSLSSTAPTPVITLRVVWFDSMPPPPGAQWRSLPPSQYNEVGVAACHSTRCHSAGRHHSTLEIGKRGALYCTCTDNATHRRQPSACRIACV
jgi:hypothetical protein